jgi:hypothetical protein
VSSEGSSPVAPVPRHPRKRPFCVAFQALSCHSRIGVCCPGWKTGHIDQARATGWVANGGLGESVDARSSQNLLIDVRARRESPQRRRHRRATRRRSRCSWDRARLSRRPLLSGGNTRSRIGTSETARPTVTATAPTSVPRRPSPITTRTGRAQDEGEAEPQPRVRKRLALLPRPALGVEEADLPEQGTGDGQLDRDHRLEVLNRYVHGRAL